MATDTSSSTSSITRESSLNRLSRPHGSHGHNLVTLLSRLPHLVPPPLQSPSRASWRPSSESGRPPLLPLATISPTRLELREKLLRQAFRKQHESSLRNKPTRETSSRLLKITIREKPSQRRSISRTRFSKKPLSQSGNSSLTKQLAWNNGLIRSSMRKEMPSLPPRMRLATPLPMPWLTNWTASEPPSES